MIAAAVMGGGRALWKGISILAVFAVILAGIQLLFYHTIIFVCRFGV